jgi:hypothetical protein
MDTTPPAPTNRVELLTVERASWIPAKDSGILTVWPDFSVPEGWERQGWTERIEPVLVSQPDGRQIEASAHISMTHIHFLDPSASLDQIWRLRVWFTDRAKGDVPVGSRILVAPEIRDAILPRNPA